VLSVTTDVTKVDQVKRFVDAVVERFGRVDVMIAQSE
jgi:NAD(P)-dependent dehydrogenase (short-subunit alcohol dehydrogenase family)